MFLKKFYLKNYLLKQTIPITTEKKKQDRKCFNSMLILHISWFPLKSFIIITIIIIIIIINIGEYYCVSQALYGSLENNFQEIQVYYYYYYIF